MHQEQIPAVRTAKDPYLLGWAMVSLPWSSGQDPELIVIKYSDNLLR